MWKQKQKEVKSLECAYPLDMLRPQSLVWGKKKAGNTARPKVVWGHGATLNIPSSSGSHELMGTHLYLSGIFWTGRTKSQKFLEQGSTNQGSAKSGP